MNLEKVDDFLTVKELSKWIKLSESHIYFLVNKRKIPFAKLGGKLLFDKQKIREWIESNSPEPEFPTEPIEPEVKPEKVALRHQEVVHKPVMDINEYENLLANKNDGFDADVNDSDGIPNDNEVPV